MFSIQYSQRNVLLQLVREVPLAEDALLRLHLIGLGEDHFINHADTLDITEKMILRAALLRTGLQGIVANNHFLNLSFDTSNCFPVPLSLHFYFTPFLCHSYPLAL